MHACYSVNVILLMLVLTSSCQRKPALAPSADTMSEMEPPPMGASTYNDELKRELAMLEDILEQRVDKSAFARVKQALMTGTMNDAHKAKPEDALLTKVLLTMPELVHLSGNLSPNRKTWLVSKYYFLNRRFIEAATMMSQVIKSEPNFFEARSWRARALFFLGNPGMAIDELSLIVANTTDKRTALEAQYLLGAIVFEANETNETNPKMLAKGIDAWSSYLTKSDEKDELRGEITKGLVELRARKDGTHKLIAQKLDPFTPSENYSAEKNSVLKAFAKEELLLALQLADDTLKISYDPVVATIKARILFKNGDLEEAAKLFAEIVKKDPTFAPGHHYRGMAFMMQSKPKDAVASWKKTLEVDQAYGQSHGLMQRIAVAESMTEPVQKIDMH